jgi:hypothetical protein
MTAPQPRKSIKIPMDLTLTVESLKVRVPRSRLRSLERSTPAPPIPFEVDLPWAGKRRTRPSYRETVHPIPGLAAPKPPFTIDDL